MLKHYMLIIFKPGECYRSATDSPPLKRALELYGKCNAIEEIEVYKFISKSNDYKYMCTIKFDRGLLHG